MILNQDAPLNIFIGIISFITLLVLIFFNIWNNWRANKRLEIVERRADERLHKSLTYISKKRKESFNISETHKKDKESNESEDSSKKSLL